MKCCMLSSSPALGAEFKQSPKDDVMKIAKLFESVVYSNIYISLGSLSIAVATSLILSLPLLFQVLLPPFLVTFSMYTLNRKMDLEEDMLSNRQRASFVRRYKKWLVPLTAVAYVLAMLIPLLAGHANMLAAVVLLIPLISGILYSVKILPFRKYKRLKQVPIVKNLMVGFNWAILGVLYPAVYASAPLEAAFLYIFIFIFLRLFIGAAFFDMKDIEGDMREGTKTIPIMVGKEKAIKIFFGLNAASFFLFFVSPTFLCSFLVLNSLFGFVYIYLYNKMDRKYLYDFFVDGEYVLTALFVSIGLLF